MKGKGNIDTAMFKVLENAVSPNLGTLLSVQST